MNERIRELADQAAEDMSGALMIPNEFCKKFAELIVKECADQIRYCQANDVDFVAKNIEKHFGVE